jgi:hypothetical protein
MEKIKQFIESEKGKDVLVVIIIILVGLGCFELGRLSEENGSSGIRVEYPKQDNNAVPPGNSTQISIKSPETSLVSISSGKNFFASSKGSKYYSISCSAGKTIKEENRVWFATGEEAQAAGYKLSSACQ